ncbi:hypothetical protein FACS1894216_02190 [Synergistales bacterium]|nr:hypothetical protein FACS1894216_02190 [Synergistales bacterium]
MAKINSFTKTNEVPDRDGNIVKWGTWELCITAGLDESPEAVLAEARTRIEGAINALPPEKRIYPRPALETAAFYGW